MAFPRLFPTLLTLALLGAAGGSYYYYQRSRSVEAPPSYNTATIARGNVRQVVTATGQLDAVLSVDVGSQISGLIVKLHADFNTVVKKDQIIAEIDPATYRQRLRQAEADLASTKASNRLQQLNTERTRELAAKSLVTRQELDQAEALLAQSNASLLTREASVENANVDLARCTIRSPIDGIVISKQTEEGKTVAASLNAPTLFTIANDLAKMQITAAVAEADIGSVQQAQSVTFTVDAFPNRNFTGQVTQVRNAPKMASNVVTYETIISVDNRDLKLRPGMTANVSIIVASRENTLRVPNSSLRVRLPEAVAAKLAATSPTPAAGAASPAAPTVAAAATPPAGERPPRENASPGEGGGRRGGMLGADATPEQREKARAVMAEVGITNFREATPEQREQFRRLMVERGLAPAPAAPGEVTVITRTVYRLPGGDKTALPQPVSIKVGITDGITSEVIDGLAEGDVIITGLAAVGNATGTAPAANPFGGQRRF
ncbi:Macrolide export protein MacA [Lacunisphaera limnophila]|uniref:Macrolide export protein MacA n=1 Tax=Lacunisphaera limnophila TaxID=1838286 RepID=A0A1D8AXD4_9BACT|nr:efflux RND transporter periplasmic adaptor subunit [Lacunisphaera limnophila]AOS45548.1 Macrolide export protein MacA [Lacunisphaera limnophila]